MKNNEKLILVFAIVTLFLVSIIAISQFYLFSALSRDKMVNFHSCLQSSLKSSIHSSDNGTIVDFSQTVQRKVKPDQVKISFSIVSVGNNVSEAVKKNAEINNRIISVFNNSYSIETTQYSITENRVWNKTALKVDGYKVFDTLTITTSDIGSAGKIISKVVSLGANRVESLTFGLKPETVDKIKSELLTEAINQAKQKLEIIMKDTGKTKYSVLEINPQEWYFNPVFRSLNSVKGEAQVPVFMPEKQVVRYSVNFKFRLY